MQTLVARATRAFLEYCADALAQPQAESERVYRHIPYGRDLDVFVLDMRSYRGPNTLQPAGRSASADTAFLGARADRMAEARSCRSRARPGKSSPPTCRSACRSPTAPTRRAARSGKPSPTATARCSAASSRSPSCCASSSARTSRNIVWLTADVHYCAAHYYDPSKAQFQDFDPFWEFVAGPLHAGSFGPNAARQHLRAAGRVPEGAAGRQHAAQRRLPVLRPGGHRSSAART